MGFAHAASRVYPTCALFMLISGKPEIRAQLSSFNFPNILICTEASTASHRPEIMHRQETKMGRALPGFRSRAKSADMKKGQINPGLMFLRTILRSKPGLVDA